MIKRLMLGLAVLLVLTVLSPGGLAPRAKAESAESLDARLHEADKLISEYKKKGKIPGLSVVIISGGQEVYKKGFGYADPGADKLVDDNTVFELGSNSKAFTALAALKLEQDGKLKLDDPVDKYLPWFRMKYAGQLGARAIDDYVPITLSQLMYHTSGIPFQSIRDIPASDSDDSIRKTVEALLGYRLDFYPGTAFSYATMNYDVLGLVIEQASGMKFEDYVAKEVLAPLGLTESSLARTGEPPAQMAQGHKISFLRAREYHPPAYRGNTPAGYVLTDAKDLSRWIRIQMGAEQVPDSFKALIERSHNPDRTVAPSEDGSSYAAGWSIYQDGSGEWSHAGENPTFSSHIVMRQGEQLGIGVLANLNSSYTSALAQDLMNIMTGEKIKRNVTDKMIYFDNAASVAVMITVPLILYTAGLLAAYAVQIARGRRSRVWGAGKIAASLGVMLLFLGGFAYCLYQLPGILFFDLSWSFVKVWAPGSVEFAVYSIFTAVAGFTLLYWLTTVFPKKNDKSLFLVSILSIVSGLGNAVLIFIVNEIFARKMGVFHYGLFLFFLLGLVLYVCGQRMVRVRLLKLTNQWVYEKRVRLIEVIQDAPYEKIRSLEDGKIHAGLNNDTETVSIMANLIVTACTSVITLICCFIYIGLINFYGFLLSLGIILLAAGLYFLVGQYANGIYERTRDVQNVFFRFINDLVGGFKELKLNRRKRMEFREDMLENCQEYRDQKIKAALAFANVFVAGELLFSVIIGVVAFSFPLIFPGMESNQLRNFIFIFLYMTGPVNAVLSTIPEIIRANISNKRINSLIEEISEGTDRPEPVEEPACESVVLCLEQISYSYAAEEARSFRIGPVNWEFRSGQVTFITGGNGSGKTTLGHIITGLYAPERGRILLNGKEIGQEELSQVCSAVYSDYYLFSKLYGIRHEGREEEIREYLETLRMDEKVAIQDGAFSTTRLSSGQRKRLGLLLTYLEDRSIFFFDEWAADQEPAFREFFYLHLLPELKAKGKCVIAITHDDRYFDQADQLLEMELGRVKSMPQLSAG